MALDTLMGQGIITPKQAASLRDRTLVRLRESIEQPLASNAG